MTAIHKVVKKKKKKGDRRLKMLKYFQKDRRTRWRYTEEVFISCGCMSVSLSPSEWLHGAQHLLWASEQTWSLCWETRFKLESKDSFSTRPRRGFLRYHIWNLATSLEKVWGQQQPPPSLSFPSVADKNVHCLTLNVYGITATCRKPWFDSSTEASGQLKPVWHVLTAFPPKRPFGDKNHSVTACKPRLWPRPNRFTGWIKMQLLPDIRASAFPNAQVRKFWYLYIHAQTF